MIYSGLYTCSEDKLYSEEQLALVNTYCDTNQKKTSEALIFAAQNDHLKIVKALLAKGAQVDSVNNNGATALMLAAQNGHLEIVKELLASGPNVDVQNQYGSTALMFAAYNGYLPIVEALLAKGAQVDLKTLNGNTALIFAAQNGHLPIVKALENNLKKQALIQALKKHSLFSYTDAEKTEIQAAIEEVENGKGSFKQLATLKLQHRFFIGFVASRFILGCLTAPVLFLPFILLASKGQLTKTNTECAIEDFIANN